MTREDWLRAAEIWEEETEFTNQKRAMVLHKKHGRLHMHVVFERYNHETGKMITNRFSRYKQDRARKRMEHEFKHLRTPDKNLERPQLRKLFGALWRQHPTSGGFLKAASEKGYTIALRKGKRPYALINSEGYAFDLAKDGGIKTKEIRERFGIDLPSDKHVIRFIREKQKARKAETEKERFKRELQEQETKARKKTRGR